MGFGGLLITFPSFTLKIELTKIVIMFHQGNKHLLDYPNIVYHMVLPNVRGWWVLHAHSGHPIAHKVALL